MCTNTIQYIGSALHPYDSIRLLRMNVESDGCIRTPKYVLNTSLTLSRSHIYRRTRLNRHIAYIIIFVQDIIMCVNRHIAYSVTFGIPLGWRFKRLWLYIPTSWTHSFNTSANWSAVFFLSPTFFTCCKYTDVTLHFIWKKVVDPFFLLCSCVQMFLSSSQ